MAGSGKLELQRISEQKQELEEQQMIAAHLNKLENELDDARWEILDIENYRDELMRRRADSEIDLRERDAVECELLDIEGKRKHMRQKIEVLEAEVQKLSEQLLGNSKIDKFQILQNIRTVMKAKNIKVGQIEKEAGCTTGYMSRLEKKGSATSPSLEFVATAAEILGVSMDLLVKSNIDEISSTDMYMVEFVTELTRRTNTQELIWKKYDPKNNPQENPFIVQVYGRDIVDSNMKIDAATYQSLFFDDAEFYAGGDGYWTRLPDGDSKIYIIPVLISLNSGIKGTATEVYLTYGDDQLKPLFNTYECCKALSDVELTLYMAVRESIKKIHLDDKTKSIIDQFMTLGKR